MTTATAVDVKDTALKIGAIIDFLEDDGLIERRVQMETIFVAFLSRSHLILHGKPGVAKSMTVDGILKHVPFLRLFKTQAYKASPPEQFIGPISLKQMAEDKFVRITTRKMADCEVAFVDELPRAPRAMLPAFQGMMVEREFDSGNGMEHVDLNTLVGTSNHLPADEELGAFFDRFAFKLIVKAPQSQQSFVEILKGALARRAQGATTIPDSLILTRDEFEAMQAAVDRCHIPDDVLQALGELWANLLGVGIEPSIRRYVDVTRGMQAVAVLDGRDEVTIDDLQIAQHSMWTTEEEQPTVYTEVVKFASEWVKMRAALLGDFQDSLDRLGKIQSLVANGTDLSTKITVDEREKSITDHAIALVFGGRTLGTKIEKHLEEREDAQLRAVLTQIGAAREWVQDRVLGGLSV